MGLLKEIKNIGKQTAIYGLGSLLSRALGFLLLPFYTHYIIPEEYGVMSLLDLSGYVISVLISLQISTAFLKYYFDCDDEDEKKKLSNSSLFLVFTIGIVFLGIFEICAPFITVKIIGDLKYTILFRLLFITLFFESLQNVFLSYLRARELSMAYTIFGMAKVLMSLLLNIYFIAFRKMGITGIFLSNAIVSVLFSLPCVLWMSYKAGFKISSYYLKNLLYFSAPLIPMGFFELILHSSDQFFLKTYWPLSVVGIYSVSYRFGTILGVLIYVPFNLMWGAKLFDLSKKEHGKIVQQKVFTYLLFFILLGCLAICLPIKEIISLITSNEYHEAYKTVPLIVIGYAFFGLNWIFRGGLLIHKKTGLVLLAAALAALGTLIFNWLLIRAYGAFGAAWASLLSYCLYSTLMYGFSHKYYPVTYEGQRVVKLVAAVALLYLISNHIPNISLVLTLVIKGLLVLSYPVLLYFLNFYDSKEKNIMLNIYYEGKSLMP